MYNFDLNHRVVCYKIVFHWHDLFYMDYHQYLPFVQRFYAAFGHLFVHAIFFRNIIPFCPARRKPKETEV